MLPKHLHFFVGFLKLAFAICFGSNRNWFSWSSEDEVAVLGLLLYRASWFHDVARLVCASLKHKVLYAIIPATSTCVATRSIASFVSPLRYNGEIHQRRCISICTRPRPSSYCLIKRALSSKTNFSNLRIVCPTLSAYRCRFSAMDIPDRSYVSHAIVELWQKMFAWVVNCVFQLLPIVMATMHHHGGTRSQWIGRWDYSCSCFSRGILIVSTWIFDCVVKVHFHCWSYKSKWI